MGCAVYTSDRAMSLAYEFGLSQIGFNALLCGQPQNRHPLALRQQLHLYSLSRLRESDPDAVVGFFPSDHYFEDDEALTAHVGSAFEAAEPSSARVVLLGIAPSSPEVTYGWIQPGAPLTNHAFGTVFEVSGFWEKPKLSLSLPLSWNGAACGTAS